jgi:hypothetical protein
MTLSDAFDQFVQIFNSATGATPTGQTFDDLRPWLDPEVILRKAAADPHKHKFFVRPRSAVIHYLKSYFIDPAISFDPYHYGNFSMETDANFVVGWVSGTAKWTDNGSPAPGGEAIEFFFTFINNAVLPNGTAQPDGDWKILFLYGSN